MPACGMITAAAAYGPMSLGIAICCIVRNMPFLTASMVPAIRGSFNALAAVALGMILYGWSMCRQVDLTWVCFVSVSESMCGYCLFDRTLTRSRIEVCIPRTFRVHRLMGMGMYMLGSGLV